VIALTAVASVLTLSLGLVRKPRDEAAVGDLVSAA
jgi:hypothetical protein